MVVAGAIGGGATIVSGIIGMGSARKARKRAEREARAKAAELARLERSRQAIINPYSGVRDISSLASDLTGMVSNPYASLGVATKAAEFQAEQADMSLANTLDTLQQTGASAGGATALAQAALQSKKEISANIEQQESENQKLRAQGEQNLQQLKMSEAQRLQGIQMSEAQRVQEADVAGKQFMFSVREGREVAQMDRVAGQMQQAQAQAAQARADQMGALTGMIGGLGSIASSMAASNTGSGSNSPTNSQVRSLAGGLASAFAPSDRILKTNIENIGISPSGLNIYSFKYKDDKFGKGLWQGVMADEVPSFAVSKTNDGYYQVDYSLIDVEFKQI
jgi:hypothetical protein